MTAIEPTARSTELRVLAQRLASRCPAGLGQEIVLFGSVGWGTVDEHSDIDLDFWVDEIPPVERVTAWLAEEGVEPVGEAPDAGEGMHVIGRWQGEWVELTWHTTAWRAAVFDAILAGGELGREKLVHAWNAANGLALRTGGRLGEWQRRLAHYPEALPARLAAECAAFWLYPHHIEMLWTLAARRAWMGLDEWLLADLQDGLRILFAANRQWEPDWKNLAAVSRGLPRSPSRLLARVDRVFRSPEPEARVECLLRLLADILSLLDWAGGADSAAAGAMRNIEASLRAHAPLRRAVMEEGAP